MTRVVIAFGSNVGDRNHFIQSALTMVKQWVEVDNISGLYESAAMYLTEQAEFLNGVMIGRTDLTPRELLLRLKSVEGTLDRRDRGRNGPREIDLDIVWMEGEVSKEDPALPHPRAHERRFVLEPLAELDGQIELQGYGRVDELLMNPVTQSQVVRRVADAPVLV